MSDAGRTEARAGTVGGAGVEGGAEKGDVVVDGVGAEAGVVGETAKGGDAGEDGVGLGEGQCVFLVGE